MKPGQLVLLDPILPLLLGLAAVDADDLDPALGVGVELLHVRNTFHAPVAPSSPEIQDDVLLLVEYARKGEILTCRILESEVGRRHAVLDLFGGLGNGLGPLRAGADLLQHRLHVSFLDVIRQEVEDLERLRAVLTDKAPDDGSGENVGRPGLRELVSLVNDTCLDGIDLVDDLLDGRILLVFGHRSTVVVGKGSDLGAFRLAAIVEGLLVLVVLRSGADKRVDGARQDHVFTGNVEDTLETFDKPGVTGDSEDKVADGGILEGYLESTVLHGDDKLLDRLPPVVEGVHLDAEGIALQALYVAGDGFLFSA